MEPGVNWLHAISLFGRFGFALLLIIRPMYFGKRLPLGMGGSLCFTESFIDSSL